jgi:hypothetical protein
MARQRVFNIWTRAWTPGLAAVGFLVVLVGMWTAFVALVGPYFSFGFDTNHAWTWSEWHWTLSIGPGLTAVVGGCLLAAGSVTLARLGASVALTAGAWLVTGPFVHGVWGSEAQPLASADWLRALLWIGWYAGTGAILVALSAYAFGLMGRRRLTTTGSAVLVEAPVEPAAAEPAAAAPVEPAAAPVAPPDAVQDEEQPLTPSGKAR